MPFIQIDETQFPLGVGETTIGTGGDAMIRVPGSDQAGVRAVVRVASDRSVAILRSGAAEPPGREIRVNGVALGAEPTPLLHGDKIEISGRELLFGDEKRGGRTQFLSGADVQEMRQRFTADSTTPRPTAATGGRLVSLVDGREYQIPEEGIIFGRDASCDIVVPGEEISRRHARILAGAEGYELEDTSTNGVLVNGNRVEGKQLLGRGDVLRLGKEDFRFYADVPQPEEVPLAVPQLAPTMVNRAIRTPPAGAVPAAPSTPPARDPQPPPRVDPPPTAPAPSQPAPAAASTDATRPALATLEIVAEGVLKGKRFEVRTPLVHVGRGAHNDVVIPDDSVSDSHAKLQKRDDGWHVVDISSTNGTYVGGRRIQGEAPIVGAPDLRFGGIKMVFRPNAAAGTEVKGTRAIAGPDAEQLRKAAEWQRKAAEDARKAAGPAKAADPMRKAADPSRRPIAPAVVPTPAPEKKRGLPVWVWIIAFLLVAALVAYFVQGTR